MKDEFLPLLAEPGTGLSLDLEVGERRDGEIWDGSLRPSGAPSRVYPIRDGIPRFVPSDQYTGSFGLQWNRYATVQLDSRNGTTYSRDRFLDETRWNSDSLAGRWVLDGGCGCGRFAEVAADLGANVVALDYSSAVDAARKNLGAHPNAHFVQGDLLNPPFRRNAFDFAYSIGVLQHTPDPAAALRAVIGLVGPGGAFALTIYGRRWYTPFNAKYVIRPLTRRIPPKLLLAMVRGSMPALFPITDVLYRIPGLGRLARFAIPVANYVDKTGFTRDQRYAECELDTFDMLAPRFDAPMTVNEVRDALEDAGVDPHAVTFLTEAPVNVVGRTPRPATRSGRAPGVTSASRSAG